MSELDEDKNVNSSGNKERKSAKKLCTTHSSRLAAASSHESSPKSPFVSKFVTDSRGMVESQPGSRLPTPPVTPPPHSPVTSVLQRSEVKSYIDPMSSPKGRPPGGEGYAKQVPVRSQQILRDATGTKSRDYAPQLQKIVSGSEGSRADGAKSPVGITKISVAGRNSQDPPLPLNVKERRWWQFRWCPGCVYSEASE
jgi:hypothetical protein